MLSNEDLLAISDLLDKKFKPIDTKTDRLKEEVNSLRIETQAEIQNIKLLLENDVVPRIRNRESCYTDTYERYIVGVDEIEAMKADIEIMKKLLHEHQVKLQAL